MDSETIVTLTAPTGEFWRYSCSLVYRWEPIVMLDATLIEHRFANGLPAGVGIPPRTPGTIVRYPVPGSVATAREVDENAD